MKRFSKLFVSVGLVSMLLSGSLFALFPAKAEAATYTYRDTGSDHYVVGPIVPSSGRGNVSFRMRSTGQYVYIDIAGSGSCEYTIRTNNGQQRDNNATLKVDTGGTCGTLAGKSYSITIGTPTGGGGGSSALVGRWVNHSTIIYNGNTYFDSKIDDDLSFVGKGISNCSVGSVINGFPQPDGSDTRNAVATVKIKLCTGEVRNIKFTDGGNFSTYFWWQDATTISSTDEKTIVFHQIQPDKDFFGDGGGSGETDTPRECFQSAIDTQVNFSSGVLRLRNKNLDQGWPGEIAHATLKTTAGCRVSNPMSVKIGGVANSQKKGGSWNGDSNDGSNGGTNGGSCESLPGPLNWVICPVIELLDSATNALDNAIQAQLQTPEVGDNQQLKEAWGRLRNIALIILVPIMLIMVIGTAIGFQGLDAYTVKRAMPRLLIAVVFISLSWYITMFLISLTNAVGAGVYGLLTNPFNLANKSLSDMVSAGSAGTLSYLVIFGGLIYGIAGGVGFAIVGSLAFTAFVALFLAFCVLVLRNVFIFALVLLAPLAILAWIFPNNDRMWKLWWGTFSKLLIMYPMIMALIASGKIFASIIPIERGGGGGIITNTAIIVAYIAPFFFIPATFKFAGGVFANLSGIINDRGRGLFDRQKKFRQEQRAKGFQSVREGNRFKGGTPDNWRGRFNRGLQGASYAGKAGFRPSRWRENIQTAQDAGNLEMALKKSEELQGAKAFFSSDDLMRAGLESGGDYNKARQYLINKGWTPDEANMGAAQANQMRREMGSEHFNLAALAKLPATGTDAVGDDISQWFEDVGKYTHGNRGLQASMAANGKAGFRAAQRYEVSEASFGTFMEAIKMAETGQRKIKNADGTTTTVKVTGKDITEFVTSAAYEAGGAQAVTSIRNAAAAEQMVKAAKRDLSSAFVDDYEHEKYNPDTKSIDTEEQYQERRKRRQLRAFAQLANIQDQLPGAKRVVSDVIANQLFAERFEDGTILDHLNALRSDPAFTEARREYAQERSGPDFDTTGMTPDEIRAEVARRQAERPPGKDGEPGVGGGLRTGL